MTLESSASKQEGGVQPGCLFFLFSSESVHLFKSSWRSPMSCTDPSGFAPVSLCQGTETYPPTCTQTQAASVFPSSFSPPPQASTFTVNPPGIHFLPDKPHQQKTDIKDAGQIWKWSFKPQNEWREEVTFQFLSPSLAGQAKASIF